MNAFLGAIACVYNIYGFPFANVTITQAADGSYLPYASISQQQGPAHNETFVIESNAAGELVHGWIAKESSENSIEMIVYETALPDGNSKLINHHISFGQESWGNCK